MLRDKVASLLHQREEHVDLKILKNLGLGSEGKGRELGKQRE